MVVNDVELENNLDVENREDLLKSIKKICAKVPAERIEDLFGETESYETVTPQFFESLKAIAPSVYSFSYFHDRVEVMANFSIFTKRDALCDK